MASVTWPKTRRPQRRKVSGVSDPRETSALQAMSDAVLAIQRLPGVLSASLVYQCADTLQAMNEEMPHAQA